MTSALEGVGGPGKVNEVREFSRGGCVNMRTRGEGVKKNRKNFADIIDGRPLIVIFFAQ